MKNLFPWRLRYRILDPVVKTVDKNPLSGEPYFNPYMGNCMGDVLFTPQKVGAVATLQIDWKNCQIDSGNNFDFSQIYSLDDSESYFEMKYKIKNNNVNKYSLYNVRSYLTFIDDKNVNEYGLTSEREIESTVEPGYNLFTKSNQDLCSL